MDELFRRPENRIERRLSSSNDNLRITMKINRFVLTSLLAFASGSVFAAPPAFVPTGVLEMIPTSMSDDASIIVGTGIFGAPNLYYTEAGGAIVIGDGCASGLTAISGDGSTVLGCNVDAQGNENAAKWLGGTSWLDLGSEAGAIPCGTLLSGSWGVNHDGSLGVGLLWRAQVCHANAGTWDLINGGPATVLQSIITGPSTRANAVNADGTVIVGWQDQATGERNAAKWVNGVPEFITNDDGSFNGEAQAVSADGKFIVGGNYKYTGVNAPAWIWQEGKGVSPIGVSTHGHSKGNFTALDVSDNGNVVVGFIQKGQFKEKAFIWRSVSGAAYLDEFLSRNGATIPPGWTLNVASIISPDGHTIYGWGFNPDSQIEMFKVEL
jgi:probable HAF family extracellular repeat protein